MVCTKENSKQHIIQTEQGLGLNLDSLHSTISLYNKEHQQQLKLSDSKTDKQIKISTQIGEINIYAKRELTKKN